MSLASQLGGFTGQATFEKYAAMEKEGFVLGGLGIAGLGLGAAGLGSLATWLASRGGKKKQQSQMQQSMVDSGIFKPGQLEQFIAAQEMQRQYPRMPFEQALQFANMMHRGGGGGGQQWNRYRQSPWDYRPIRPRRSLADRLDRRTSQRDRLQAQMDKKKKRRDGGTAAPVAPVAATPAVPAPTTTAPTTTAPARPAPTTPAASSRNDPRAHMTTVAPKTPQPGMVNPPPTGDLPDMYDQEMYEMNRPDRDFVTPGVPYRPAQQTPAKPSPTSSKGFGRSTVYPKGQGMTGWGDTSAWKVTPRK